jgi:hypothetical protein
MEEIALSSLLLADLGDATVALIDWDGASHQMSLRVEKESGESGLLQFERVSFIRMEPRFDITAMRAFSLRTLPAAIRPLLPENVDDHDTVFVFDESWGETQIVIAAKVSYAVEERPAGT